MAAWTRIDEVPFDFERRRISVLVDRAGSRMLVVKGAPEELLTLCAQYEETGPDDLRPVDSDVRSRVRALVDDLGRNGLRVLAIAWKPVEPDHPHAVVTDETALVFAGIVAFQDPPKPSAAGAIRRLSEAGVAVKIISGDSELVTQHVCAQIGIPVAGMLLGQEIATLDGPALAARAEAVNLFCRVTPAQKERIILALRSRGHVVGFPGNGINDSPSLHVADVGISVDGSVAAALALPFSPVGRALGFVPPPAHFFGILASIVLAYLLMVEAVKRWFYRTFGHTSGAQGRPRPPQNILSGA